MPSFKILKIWQSDQHELIFSLSPTGSSRHEWGIKKFFLTLSARSSHYGIFIHSEKPKFTIFKNPLIEIFRKHASNLVIGHILKTNLHDDYYVLLYDRKGQPFSWVLRMQKTRPPELALINNSGNIFVRHSQNSTYTKKRETELPLFFDSNGKLNPDFQLIDDSLMESSGLLPKDSGGHEGIPDEQTEVESQGTEKSHFSAIQKQVLQKIKRRLKTAEKAFLKEKDSIPSSDEINQLSEKAQLLQSYSYLVKEGDFALKISANMNNHKRPVIIDLDPEKGIGRNIEDYYIRIKKLQKARKIGLERLKQNQKSIDQMKFDLDSLKESSLDEDALRKICINHKIKWITGAQSKSSKVAKTEESKPFKIFRSSTGHMIFVGKGPKENDQLTKSAKANDYWIHSAGSAGSHVIIPCKKDIKDQLPEALLREAALLAIYYSKYKSDLAGETYIARKSEIKKQKGMPAGLWNVERCKTIFWRFDQSELKEILNRLEI